jgi:hypothetical protein
MSEQPADNAETTAETTAKKPPEPPAEPPEPRNPYRPVDRNQPPGEETRSR